MAGRRLVIVGVSVLVAGLGVTVASAATPGTPAKSPASAPYTIPYRCPDNTGTGAGSQTDNYQYGWGVFAGQNYDTRVGACVKVAGKAEEEMLQAQDSSGAGAVLDTNGRASAGVYWDGGTQVCYISGGTWKCNKP